MPQSPKSPKSPLRSPGSSRAPTADGTIALQVTQFLDDWHFRIMKTSLGKTWTRDKVVVSALELLMLNGVDLSEQDIKWMADPKTHEEAMIKELITKMPWSIRENFESLAAQLKLLLTTATRVRMAIDQGGDGEIAEVMEEEDHGVVKEQILKAAVIQASKEVSHLVTCRDTWVKSTERRLARLTRSAELAEEAQQQLLKIDAQLARFSSDTKSKTLTALMGFCANSDTNILHASFANWVGIAIKNRAEREYRKKFEEELAAKEMFLIEMKKKAIENVTAALGRKLMEGDSNILSSAFLEWRAEVGGQKREKEEAAEVAKLEEKMSQFTAEQAATAKAVMARMNQDSDETTVVSVFNAWVQATAVSKSEREVNELLAKSEQQYKEYMEQRKESTKAMLQRMVASSDSGLLHTVVTSWAALTREFKESRRIEEAIAKEEHKFKFLKDRQKTGATKLQGRVTEQMKANLLVRVVSAWELHAKMARIEVYYKNKMEGKRAQLENVRKLFSSFADKLEEGLGNVDGDSSGRGESRARRSRMSRDQNSVSLPNIHERRP